MYLKKMSAPLAPSEIQSTNVPAAGAAASVRGKEPPFEFVTVMVLPDSVAVAILPLASPARSI